MLVPPQTLPGEQLWCACRTVYLGHTAHPERINWLLMHAGFDKEDRFVVRGYTAFGWYTNTEWALSAFLKNSRFASMHAHAAKAALEWPQPVPPPTAVPAPAPEEVISTILSGEVPCPPTTN